MKKFLIYSIQIALLSMLSSCSSSDDSSATPSNTSDDGFISPISQGWTDSAGVKTFFFGQPDSAGRFTGVETDNGQQFLSGKTYRFDISFTVILDQQTNYIDYVGKITDTLSTHMRMVVYSKVDTLYLRP